MNERALTIGMVAGEASGDNLGAPLIRELKARCPDARFIGVGGKAMIEEGFESLFDIERLSVNGIVDPLKRLPDLIRMVFALRRLFRENEIDCFIGVDFNFFNGWLETMMKKDGVRNVHYVSPTIWAWRSGRIKKIARDIDLMLTLYPFENAIYETHGVRARFVGHPKAHEIAMDQGETQKIAARQSLEIDDEALLIAILPGSRGGEVEMSGPDFFRAAALLHKDLNCQFVVPAANEKRLAQIRNLWSSLVGDVPVQVIQGDALKAMTAADAVLVNSGTATLEALLLRRPMVMSYRLGRYTYALVSRMVKTAYFALPNILHGGELVPEFIQDDATPQALADAMKKLLAEPHEPLMETFTQIHKTLRTDSGSVAAEEILNLLEES
jgi:lipid-A-disaccharide synthase